MHLRINFGDVPDDNTFTPLPDGKYVVRISEITERFTKNGDEMWSMKLVVVYADNPAYIGRFIYDTLVFSAAGLRRLKLFRLRLGMPVGNDVEVSMAELLDKVCVVTVFSEEYIGKEGSKQVRNKVPFDGYAPYDDEADTLHIKVAQEEDPF